MRPDRQRRIVRWLGPSFERRLALDLALLAAPLCVVAASAASVEAVRHHVEWWILAALLAAALLAWRLYRRVLYPVRGLSNLLDAVKEGDYSLRGTAAGDDGAFGAAVREVNALAAALREQRLAAEETHGLLSKVLGSIDVAIFGFDAQRRLRLVNPAGAKLVGRSAADALGASVDELGLSECLDRDDDVVECAFDGRGGRYQTRHFRFRDRGEARDLLTLSDVSRPLRNEERVAWQRLVRVLGHELGNSLGPIRSIAQSLVEVVRGEPVELAWRDEAADALGVIADRADSLNRFAGTYSALSRLPEPNRRACDVEALLRRVAAMEPRVPVRVAMTGEARPAMLDPDLIEQAIINLVRNAADATLPASDAIVVVGELRADRLFVDVVDAGSGLAGVDNLFVPFFSTKPTGAGIGLVLARQIVESHDGSLRLRNRDDAAGCIARIEMPA